MTTDPSTSFTHYFNTNNSSSSFLLPAVAVFAHLVAVPISFGCMSQIHTPGVSQFPQSSDHVYSSLLTVMISVSVVCQQTFAPPPPSLSLLILPPPLFAVTFV